MKLTKEERAAAFRGTLRVLRRPQKPETEPGEEIVLSTTKGGRHVIDRDSGETIELQKQPRLSITVKGWKLRAGDKEWEAEVVIHDRREQNRNLANGLGGIPREPGLKTRWGTRVIHSGGDVKVVPKRVPSRAEQHENWTPETERGYGGRGTGDYPQEADKMGIERTPVPSTGVDDVAFAEFSVQVEPVNLALRHQRRADQRRGNVKMRLRSAEERGATGTAGHLNGKFAA